MRSSGFFVEREAYLRALGPSYQWPVLNSATEYFANDDIVQGGKLQKAINFVFLTGNFDFNSRRSL